MSYKAFRIMLIPHDREAVSTISTARALDGSNVRIVDTKPLDTGGKYSIKCEDVINWLSTHGFSMLRTDEKFATMKNNDIECLLSNLDGNITSVILKIEVSPLARKEITRWYSLVLKLCESWGLTMLDGKGIPSEGEFFSYVEKTFAWQTFLQLEEQQSILR